MALSCVERTHRYRKLNAFANRTKNPQNYDENCFPILSLNIFRFAKRQFVQRNWSKICHFCVNYASRPTWYVPSWLTYCWEKNGTREWLYEVCRSARFTVKRMKLVAIGVTVVATFHTYTYNPATFESSGGFSLFRISVKSNRRICV